MSQSQKSPKKQRKRTAKKSPRKPTKRHSKYVKSFTRKDGIYVKGHYRQVGGKRISK